MQKKKFRISTESPIVDEKNKKICVISSAYTLEAQSMRDAARIAINLDNPASITIRRVE